MRRVRIRRRLLLERLNDRRVLAAITGVVFNDADQSFRQESAELSLPSRVVFVDANDNGSFDSGERYALTNGSGEFSFDDLELGDYALRVFNGTQTQSQSYPFRATLEHQVVSVGGTNGITETDAGLVTLAADAVLIGNLEDGSIESLPTEVAPLVQMQTLPNGDLVIIGEDLSGSASSYVLSGNELTPIDLSDGNPYFWTDLAIDGNGDGVAIYRDTGSSVIVSLETDETGSLISTDTESVAPSDAQALASESGSRTVFGWNGISGLQLSLWSNPTANWITQTPVEVAGSSELLAYDDASGILVLRSTMGGVTVHDVNNDFATLQGLPEVTGPVALDGALELLYTVTDTTSSISVVDLRNAESLAELAIDLSKVGQAKEVELRRESKELLVLGSEGMTKFRLSRPAAQHVTISDENDTSPVQFGIYIDGENETPTYTEGPSLTLDEDGSLSGLAPGLLVGAEDADEDNIILLLADGITNGELLLNVDGSFDYTPNENFNGQDHFSVTLHDGMNASESIPMFFTVNAVADDPTGIDIFIPPQPENIPPGQVIAPLEVIDVDQGGNHIIVVNDHRFEVQQGNLVFVGQPGDLDFEDAPLITFLITATDRETNVSVYREVTMTITDENEPITGITPHRGFVYENEAGSTAANLQVIDEDVGQTHTLTVDDQRFVVENGDLRLADGVALDFESESFVTVNVTAEEDDGGGNSFTQQIVIQVGDSVEQVETISLNDRSVIELEPGAEVSVVELDGNQVTDGYEVSVDDDRFEIVDSVLQLKEDIWVRIADQDEIELTIQAQDVGQSMPPTTETFLIAVVANDTPFHNDESPFDVDGNGSVTALDALRIINHLNIHGPGPVGEGDPALGLDVNNDGFVTALDALLVVNELNRLREIEQNGGTVGGEPEGESPNGDSEDPNPSQELAQDRQLPSSDFLPSDNGLTPQSLPLKSGELAESEDPSIANRMMDSGDSANAGPTEKLCSITPDGEAESVDSIEADDIDASLGPFLDEIS